MTSVKFNAGAALCEVLQELYGKPVLEIEQGLAAVKGNNAQALALFDALQEGALPLAGVGRLDNTVKDKPKGLRFTEFDDKHLAVVKQYLEGQGILSGHTGEVSANDAFSYAIILAATLISSNGG